MVLPGLFSERGSVATSDAVNRPRRRGRVAAMGLVIAAILLATSGPARAEKPERRPVVAKVRVTPVPWFTSMRLVSNGLKSLSAVRGGVGLDVMELFAIEGEVAYLMNLPGSGYDAAIRAGVAPILYDGRRTRGNDKENDREIGWASDWGNGRGSHWENDGEEVRGFTITPYLLGGYRAISLDHHDFRWRYSFDAVALGAGVEAAYWIATHFGVTMRALGEVDFVVAASCKGDPFFCLDDPDVPHRPGYTLTLGLAF